MQITGILIDSSDLEKGVSKNTGKEWTKKVIVIETQDDYPKQVAIEVWNQKINKMVEIGVKKGSIITCQINLESREYNGRYYTTATARRVDLKSTKKTPEPVEEEGEDDLPF